MLTCLKKPSLACKCEFYTPKHYVKGDPMELNFELNLQNATKWNIPTDRAHRLYDKNGVIYLVIMYTPRVIIIKMSKMVHFFCIFGWRQQKNNQFGQNNQVQLRDLTELFQKKVWLIGFEVTVCEILRVKISKKLVSQQKLPKPCIFKDWHLANSSSETNNP